ncbi:MAG: replicative DNA helicase, partial [Lachnospiraceae bacterium]|nr:replicative DNA helicase [Lachnospiraceae bacterium]
MDENVIKRIMPNDLAAEQSVIGAMLLDANAISTAADILTGDDFYNKQYGVLFETML